MIARIRRYLAYRDAVARYEMHEAHPIVVTDMSGSILRVLPNERPQR